MKAEDLDKDEAEFLRVCETRVKDCEGKLKVRRGEEKIGEEEEGCNRGKRKERKMAMTRKMRVGIAKEEVGRRR